MLKNILIAWLFLPSFSMAGGTSFVVEQDRVFCEKKDSTLCAPHAASTPIDALALVQEIENTIKPKFHYEFESTDSWWSFGSEVLSSKSYYLRGDCEDLAQTMLEVAYAKGVPANQLARIIVQSGDENHMVALYIAPNGEQYYFGDTFAPLTKSKDSKYEPLAISHFGDRTWQWLVANPTY